MVSSYHFFAMREKKKMHSKFLRFSYKLNKFNYNLSTLFQSNMLFLYDVYIRDTFHSVYNNFVLLTNSFSGYLKSFCLKRAIKTIYRETSFKENLLKLRLAQMIRADDEIEDKEGVLKYLDKANLRGKNVKFVLNY
jgi:hypothetical protein